MKKLMIVLNLAMLGFGAGGCGAASKMNLVEQTGGGAALYAQVQAFDGHTGGKLTFAEVARRCAAADVVFFGEQHNDVICNAYEAQLLHALTSRSRTTALAMEFFETDTQGALDDYLAGRTDEATFLKQTRQGRDYLLSHRPMIELCRAADAPVIAANAPRRLVREYRISKLPFDQYRASLSPEDQRWLPRTSEHLPGPYFERFLEAVKDHPTTPPSPSSAPALLPMTETGAHPHAPAHSGPKHSTQDALIASFRPMLLWDDSMAESVATYRAANTDDRVMLVVGRFHVASEGGTLQKFRQRRPGDHICTIVYASRPTGAFALEPHEMKSGDIVLCGLTPPEKPESPGPMPAATNTTRPAR